MSSRGRAELPTKETPAENVNPIIKGLQLEEDPNEGR